MAPSRLNSRDQSGFVWPDLRAGPPGSAVLAQQLGSEDRLEAVAVSSLASTLVHAALIPTGDAVLRKHGRAVHATVAARRHHDPVVLDHDVGHGATHRAEAAATTCGSGCSVRPTVQFRGTPRGPRFRVIMVGPTVQSGIRFRGTPCGRRFSQSGFRGMVQDSWCG